MEVHFEVDGNFLESGVNVEIIKFWLITVMWLKICHELLCLECSPSLNTDKYYDTSLWDLWDIYCYKM